MERLPERLRDNVRLLGDALGDTLLEHEGPALFKKVEEIRSLAKSIDSDKNGNSKLVELLSQLEDKDILPITRAFNQFLNMANIADQEYFSSKEAEGDDGLEQVLTDLCEKEGKDGLLKVIENLKIDLVLTAHPTEVTRRTLIRKYEKIARALSDRSRDDLLSYESAKVPGKLGRLVEEVWTTNEIRSERPTAVDEAKWGFAVIENSLWYAVPDFIRHLDRISKRRLGQGLPLDIQPFHFYSWMGGDRDGNPNVTHKVTEEVILLGRWKAADLYLKAIDQLGNDLSMEKASDELLSQLDENSSTPYRQYLHQLSDRLEATLSWTENRLNGDQSPEYSYVIKSQADLLDPLLIIYRSLKEMGFNYIANGPVVDIIRRVYAFGINLSPLDIRQDSDRHLQVLNELTEYLGLGSYQNWNEHERQAFLLEQLSSKRPLLPASWPVSKDAEEVLATCKTIAAQQPETLSHYVISMARQPSDVLSVALLLKESGVTWDMPIVPLFETLDDLDRAPTVMQQLWELPWYKEYASGHQTVMIGYSDSAKDAGKFSATWAQYKCQEKLVELAEQNGVSLELFHGRGGTVGRGGGPVEKAMASQPPGSVKGTIRVTEQGEMIRYKFGRPRVAFSSLKTYTLATLKATVTPNPAPKQEWRDLIEKMSAQGLEGYRSIVRGHEHFVPYFRSLTPEQELNKLALGSRPAKRKSTGGVESLRAIPWVFAWMQVRLNLPSWLGTYQALQYATENEQGVLQDMLENWPFFSSFVDLLEMVLGKANGVVCEYYEQQLVDEQYRGLGQIIRGDLAKLIELMKTIKNQPALLEDDKMLQISIAVRNPYIDPLNYLQAELLKRERSTGEISPELEQALKVTMAGISAGMRNTG